MLQGGTPLAIFLFAFFEYAFFWGIVLILADGIRRLEEHFRHFKARG
jgi:hypothetical protein